MFRKHVVSDGGARKTPRVSGPEDAAEPESRPTVLIRVSDVMSRDMLVMPAWFCAENVTNLHRARHAAYPVVDLDGRPVGVIDPAALAAETFLEGRTFGEICRPLRSVPVVSPDDDINRLFAMPGVADGAGVLVVQGNRLVGIISRGYLMRLTRARAIVAA